MSNREHIAIIAQMLKRIHREDFFIKIQTYVKTLLEMQED